MESTKLATLTATRPMQGYNIAWPTRPERNTDSRKVKQTRKPKFQRPTTPALLPSPC